MKVIVEIAMANTRANFLRGQSYAAGIDTLKYFINTINFAFRQILLENRCMNDRIIKTCTVSLIQCFIRAAVESCFKTS